MARENQGLQIALIIFVMLTIVLGVTTFIFFRQYDEASIAEADAKGKAAENMEGLRNLQGVNSELKKILGFADGEGLETIQDEHRKDMLTFAGTAPKDVQFYRPMLQYLHGTIEKNNQVLQGQNTANQDLKAINERRDSGVKGQIATEKAAAVKAAQDLVDERSKFNADRSRFTSAEAALAKKLEKGRKESEEALARLQGTLEETSIQVQQLTQLNREKTKKLGDVVRESFEVADGEVTWVNQRNGTVWINLGRADGLGRQTSFSVYAADTNDVTKTGKKASVEITQILGDHVAEARIVEDEVSDPILPGDKIYTPVWSPGEQRRFALAGTIDIDGDDKSDLDMIRNLITMNGGVVDAWMDDKAIHGKMTVNTRYLVKGEAPGAGGKPDPDAIARWTKMIGEADKMGIQEIPVGQLLTQMGWRNQTPVVTYGPGGNPKDFRPLPRDGVNRASAGNVSGLFKDRQPPKKSPSGGAF